MLMEIILIMSLLVLLLRRKSKLNECDRNCVRIPASIDPPPGSHVRHQLESVQGDGREAQGGDVDRGALTQ